MKLKTKFQDENFELGEVVDVIIITLANSGFRLQCEAKAGDIIRLYYKSLKELYENWEDPKEQLGYWYYDTSANRVDFIENSSVTNEDIELDKLIGNYFKSEEECSKAAEKLKAITRLENKGFKFELWDYDGGNYSERIRTGRILFRVSDDKDADKDLDLLFGGEE